MANDCNFSMLAVGTEEDINTVRNVLEQKCVDSEGNILHLYRTGVDYMSDPIELDDGHVYVYISGIVAWSLDEWVRPSGEPYEWEGRTYRQISLARLSLMSGVSFEVFAEENGCEFNQHVCVARGQVYVYHDIPWIDASTIIGNGGDNEAREEITSEILGTFSDYLDDAAKAKMEQDVDAMIAHAREMDWDEVFYKFGGFEWSFAPPMDVLKGRVWNSKPLLYVREED